MTILRLLVTVTTGTTLVALGCVLPAAAAPTATSTATLTITGGTLDVTVSATRRHLGDRTTSPTDDTISGPLGRVVVTDRRGAPAGSGWVASVTSTAFTSDSGPAIPASQVSYTAGPITRQGTATYTANNPRRLGRARAAVTATDVTGNNTATWTPTLTVDVPSGAVPGTYTATITHSVA